MVPLQRFPVCDTTSETEGRGLTDKTLKSAQKPKENGQGNLAGIRIEVRLAQKTFKSRWETWEDSELYANGNEFGKISK